VCVTDPVLVVLGGAVVKTAVRLWVGPNVIADNFTADLTGVLESRVSDARERRKLRRRFEEMEDIVADQLLTALEVEFRGLDEGEQAAAVNAVTETFGRARVTGDVLFSQDLDPLNLERYLRGFTGDATRDLSWGGTQLYDLVLARCCAYVLEIADKLPRFQAGAFAELLKRDSQILARVEDILARLPAPAAGAAAADRVETAYRRRVVKVFDRLELFGLDFAAQWYSLSIAYVHPAVAVDGAAGAADRAFERSLAECPRLLISGRAGSGKTTILQWIAVRAARREFAGQAAPLNGCVPFFLRLRDYADTTLPAPEEFLAKIAPLLLPADGRSWPRGRLESGRAFVLIDGLDEVPEARRPAVLDWLRELTDLFPDARYVVTTRPGAVEEDLFADAGFVSANLEPMDPELVRVFIDRWHAAMGEWEDTESLARLYGWRDDLFRTLEGDRFLSELANTPLLAGLVCALNQRMGARLPRRRGEIFEKALALFHERDRKRGIAGGVALDLDATNHLLGDLALWMVRNARVEIAPDAAGNLVAADTARTILRHSALSLPARPPEDADLYGHLVLRSGVLREPAAGHLDFAHRTFQEYLASKALIRTDNVGELVRNASDDQWREVVILASGQGITRQTTQLLRGLLESALPERNRYHRRLLAVACLDEIRDADPAVLAEIDHVIPELLPPRDLNQAEVLSHAGERLLPHLERAAARAADDELLPVIRAAALIGGPHALALIAKVAALPAGTRETGDARQAELTRSRAYFDPVRYAELVVPAPVLTATGERESPQAPAARPGGDHRRQNPVSRMGSGG